jgi:hypothetical protein
MADTFSGPGGQDYDFQTGRGLDLQGRELFSDENFSYKEIR